VSDQKEDNERPCIVEGKENETHHLEEEITVSFPLYCVRQLSQYSIKMAHGGHVVEMFATW